MAKAPKVEKLLSGVAKLIFGNKRTSDSCVRCNSSKVKPEDFKDDLSRKEFTLSHYCQICQDRFFGTDKDT